LRLVVKVDIENIFHAWKLHLRGKRDCGFQSW